MLEEFSKLMSGDFLNDAKGVANTAIRLTAQLDEILLKLQNIDKLVSLIEESMRRDMEEKLRERDPYAGK